MQPPAPPRHQTSTSNTKVLLLVFLGLFLMCGVGVGGIGLLAYFGMDSDEVADEDVAESDRAMLVTFEDVAEYYELERTGGAGTFRKGGLLGSRELEYEYEDPGDGGIYLLSSVTRERTTKEARETYTAMQLTMGVMLGMAGEGVTREERNDLFKWGDDSKHYLLTADGTAVGNFFITRKGKHVYFLSLGGVAFDDPETLSELLTPRLERAVAWSPQ